MDIALKKNLWPKPVKSKNLFALLSVYFIDNFGLAMAYPIFTPLILKTHLGLLAPACGFSVRTFLLGILLASFPIGQFLGAPIFGYLADLKGRKKAFYFTLSGEICGYILSAIALYFHLFSFLLISRFITGFFAGNLAICLSSIADISGDDPQVKSKNFGLLASAMGLSFIVAIIVGGYFSNTELYPMFNSALPFIITAALAFVNLLIVQFFYQDTIEKKTRSSTFFFAGLNLPEVRFLLVIFFLFLIGWIGNLQFLSALEIEHFQSSKEAITLTFITGGILWAISNFYFNPILLKKFNPKHLVIFFLPLFALALLGIALSPLFIFFFIFFNLGSFSASIAWTNIVTLISNWAPPTVQGRTLGFNQSVSCLSTCVAPILGGILAGHGVTFIYLIYSFIVIISLFIFLFNKALSKLEKNN